MTFRFAVLLEVETNDPRLSEEALAEFGNTVPGVAKVRRAVLQHLPKDIRRLVAIMPVEQAMQLSRLHEAFGEALTGESPMRRPPPGYIPPTQD